MQIKGPSGSSDIPSDRIERRFWRSVPDLREMSGPVIWILVGAFILLRLLAVAGFDVTVAVGLLNGIGVLDVILSSVLAAVPLAGYLLISWILARSLFQNRLPSVRSVLLFVGISFFGSWDLMLRGLVATLIVSVFLILRKSMGEDAEKGRGLERWFSIPSRGVAGLLVVGSIWFVYPAFASMWLPAELVVIPYSEEEMEEIALRPGFTDGDGWANGVVYAGYLLDSDPEWTTIFGFRMQRHSFEDLKPQLFKLRSNSIEARAHCNLNQRPRPPSVAQLLTSTSEPLPNCSDRWFLIMHFLGLEHGDAEEFREFMTGQ